MLTWIPSALQKPFSDLMALHVPQLGRRNENVGWLQVMPLMMRRIKMWLGSNHRVIGIVRVYRWGEKDRGRCWRQRFVSSAEQFSSLFFFPSIKKNIQFSFYMPHLIVCNGFKIHSLCEHAEARAGSIFFYHFLSCTLGLTSFQLLAKSGVESKARSGKYTSNDFLKEKAKT